MATLTEQVEQSLAHHGLSWDDVFDEVWLDTYLQAGWFFTIIAEPHTEVFISPKRYSTRQQAEFAAARVMGRI